MPQTGNGQKTKNMGMTVTCMDYNQGWEHFKLNDSKSVLELILNLMDFEFTQRKNPFLKLNRTGSRTGS